MDSAAISCPPPVIGIDADLLGAAVREAGHAFRGARRLMVAPASAEVFDPARGGPVWAETARRARPAGPALADFIAHFRGVAPTAAIEAFWGPGFAPTGPGFRQEGSRFRDALLAAIARFDPAAPPLAPRVGADLAALLDHARATAILKASWDLAGDAVVSMSWSAREPLYLLMAAVGRQPGAQAGAVLLHSASVPVLAWPGAVALFGGADCVELRLNVRSPSAHERAAATRIRAESCGRFDAARGILAWMQAGLG